MTMDVNFSQTDMGFMPTFDIGTQMPGGGTGAVFIPQVSEEGILSWQNNGNLPNPEPVHIKGKDGIDGKDGADGYTPVKGTHYWTEADKAEMVADVIASLPVYDGEVA